MFRNTSPFGAGKLAPTARGRNEKRGDAAPRATKTSGAPRAGGAEVDGTRRAASGEAELAEPGPRAGLSATGGLPSVGVGARRRARRNVLAKLAAHQAQLSEHSKGVAALARAVARRLGLAGNEVEEVVLTAELHDVGKLALPDSLLEKAGPLDHDEWHLMRLHTVAGEQILSDLAGAAAVAPLVRSSHERWDGRGYPDGLAGEEIPVASRVVFACDAFDAMRSARPYQRPKTAAEAMEELERCAGTQFDPRVVDALVEELLWSGRVRRGGAVGSRRRE